MSRPNVAVVIAARNNAAFLRETIGSALTQSIPCEVVYSDDCSSDNSVEIAFGFSDRISVLTSSIHRGVCETRNRGAAISDSKYIVFLDGDDRLPVDFVESHLDVIEESTPFSYGPARIIGNHEMNGHVFPVPRWSDYDVWWRNTVNTSACYSRQAFDACGRWRDQPGTMWDWDLAIRASRYGTPRPSRATLDYRFHESSWSEIHGERNESNAIAIREMIRRQNIRLTIGCIYSGRLPWLFENWCYRVSQSIRFSGLQHKPEIIVVDNTAGSFELLSKEISKYEDVFESFRVIPFPVQLKWETETERRDLVAGFMSSATNRILFASRGDAIWLIEDDILVSPKSAKLLVDCLVAGDVPVHAVAGIYRNRHRPERLVFGVEIDGDISEPKYTDINFGSPFKVDATGTGCLMFWKSRPVMPKKFESHWGKIPAHDWKWCSDLRKNGGSVFVHPSVICEHVIGPGETLRLQEAHNGR